MLDVCKLYRLTKLSERTLAIPICCEEGETLFKYKPYNHQSNLGAPKCGELIGWTSGLRWTHVESRNLGGFEGLMSGPSGFNGNRTEFR
jgi:hypothetical protein